MAGPAASEAGETGEDELAGAQRRIAELERKIGQQQVDLDFFRRALRHVRGGCRPSVVPGVVRHLRGHPNDDERDAARRSHDRARCAGWRGSAAPAITASGRPARRVSTRPRCATRSSGWRWPTAGYRRGYRYITQTAAPRRPDRQSQARAAPDARGQSAGSAPAAVRAVDDRSRHPWRVVPNLARDMQLSGLDQLWVADITYIRLQEEFAYLAIVLDAFSRRVVGWAMAIISAPAWRWRR